MTDPPYWDGIFLYSQAVWLKNNHFNIFELAKQPGYFEGGPNINYMYVLVPGIALLYEQCAPQSVFLIMHIFNIFCSAFVFWAFFTILKMYIKPLRALIWCMVAFAQPIWSGQSAAIYLELPLAAGVASVFLALQQKRYGVAFGLGILSYFIKNSVILLGLSLLIFVLLKESLEKVIFRQNGKGDFSLGFFLLSTLFPLYIFIEKARSSNMHTGLYFHLLPSNLKYFWRGCPDVLILSIATSLLFCGYLFLRRQKLFNDPSERNKCYFILLLTIFTLGYCASSLLYLNPLYRYATFIIFPLITAFGILSGELFPKHSVYIALSLLLFNLANQQGDFFPKPLPTNAASGETLERSREYLEDLKTNQNFCSEIETRFFDRNIAAKYPYVQMLTIPELGYVKKALPHIFSTGLHPFYTPSKMINTAILNAPDTLYLFAANIFESGFIPSLSPTKMDKTVLAETSPFGTLSLYEHGNKNWLDSTPKIGAIKEWSRQFYNFGNLLLNRNELTEAVFYYQESLKLDSRFGDAYNNLGAAYFRLKRYEDALFHFQKAFDLNPNSDEVRQNIQRCLKMNPNWKRPVENKNI